MNNLDEGTHPFHFHGHKVTPSSYPAYQSFGLWLKETAITMHQYLWRKTLFIATPLLSKITAMP